MFSGFRTTHLRLSLITKLQKGWDMIIDQRSNGDDKEGSSAVVRYALLVLLAPFILRSARVRTAQRSTLLPAVTIIELDCRAAEDGKSEAKRQTDRFPLPDFRFNSQKHLLLATFLVPEGCRVDK